MKVLKSIFTTILILLLIVQLSSCYSRAKLRNMVFIKQVHADEIDSFMDKNINQFQFMYYLKQSDKYRGEIYGVNDTFITKFKFRYLFGKIIKTKTEIAKIDSVDMSSLSESCIKKMNSQISHRNFIMDMILRKRGSDLKDSFGIKINYCFDKNDSCELCKLYKYAYYNKYLSDKALFK